MDKDAGLGLTEEELEAYVSVAHQAARLLGQQGELLRRMQRAWAQQDRMEIERINAELPVLERWVEVTVAAAGAADRGEEPRLEPDKD